MAGVSEHYQTDVDSSGLRLPGIDYTELNNLQTRWPVEINQKAPVSCCLHKKWTPGIKLVKDGPEGYISIIQHLLFNF